MLLENEISGLLEGMTPETSVKLLVASKEAAAVYQSIAMCMFRHPSSSLAKFLPGLWLVRDEPIQAPELPTRVVTALSRLTFTVWGDLLEFTPSFLLGIQGFGEGSLPTFLTIAARTSAEACCQALPPARCPVVDVFEPIMFSPRTSRKLSEIGQLVYWATSEIKAETIASFISAFSRLDLPDDIQRLCDSIQRTRVEDLFPEILHKPSLENLVKDLLSVLDSRSRLIFIDRISLNNSRTLENLAIELGITRERVRQIYSKAEKRILKAVETPRFTPVRWRAHTLASLLGAAVPRNTFHLEEAILLATKDVFDEWRERVADLLLWLAGPYTWNSEMDWLCSREMPNKGIFEECSDQKGLVNIHRVKEHLLENGLLPDIQNIWIEKIGKVKQIGCNWLLWTGTVCDKAVRLLEIWEKPATPEVIIEAICEGHDVRVSRSRLFEDPRIIRVDMTRVGLRSWGMEEYSSIAEEIDQELERQGGRAVLNNLVTALIERFGLRENSIRLYVKAPMFILEGDMLRRRTSLDPLPAVPPVFETPGCHLLGTDSLSWRIEVNADTLRGSGRQLPASIAGWLGVTPGYHRVLAGEGGTVRITWPETSIMGPALGSIRFLAERVAAQISDQVLLLFNKKEGTIGIKKLDAALVNSAQGFERLSLLTGIPNWQNETEFLNQLGMTLGVPAVRSTVSDGFRRRGEEALASLVLPYNISTELDSAIDALKDLL